MPTTDKPVLDLTARCACGRIELRLAGQVRAMFLCACRDCQTATGTGHSAAVAMATGDVTVTGQPASFDVTAASGATTARSFCPTCGTPILARSSRAPDLVLVPAGLLGDTDAWYVPNQLIFARSHLSWDEVSAALPRHDTYRTS